MQHFLDIATTTSTSVGIGRTIADCQAIAAMYDNTCDSLDTPVDMQTHAGAQMSCTGQMRCPDGEGSEYFTEENPCIYTRKLCVTCYTDADDNVQMRIQTN